MNKDELGALLFGNNRLEGNAKMSTTSTITGTAQGTSANGKVLVKLSDNVTSSEDGDGTEETTQEMTGSTSIELDTEVHVEEGDSVSIGLVGGNIKSPRVTGVVGGGDRMQAQVENAETLAEQAEAVATATGQHFWNITSAHGKDGELGAGAYVTEIPQDDFLNTASEQYASGANVLINSIGQLFRDGLTNLLALLPAQKTTETFTGDGSTRTFTLQSTPNLKRVYKVWVDGGLLSTDDYSISGTTLTLNSAPAQDVEVKVEYRSTDATSGIAIYDGIGNEQDNIALSITDNGIVVGKEDDSHLELDYRSMTLLDKDGLSYFEVGDLRSYGGLEFENQWTIVRDGEGSQTFTVDQPINSIVAVQLNGAATEAYEVTGEKTVSVHFNTGGQYTVRIVYMCDDVNAKKFTFGQRGNDPTIPADFQVGMNSTVVGYGSASGEYSSSIGYETAASGQYAHAEGEGSAARGRTSHAEGRDTLASGQHAHAQNIGTIASGNNQTALGRWNVADTTSALIVGNGTDDSNRSNAFALDFDGNLETAGNVTASGNLAAAGAFEVNTTDIDATQANNGVTSTRYVGDYMNDKNKKALGAMEVVVNPNGTISQQFYVRNYNTDGTSAGFHGLKIDAKKDGSQTVNLVGTGAKAAWLSALGLDQPLIATQKQTVTVAANQVVLRNITAPTVSGYVFSHWLQPASSGHITSAYMADPTAQTTNLWVPGSATSGSRSFVVTAVYYLTTS